MEKILFLAGVIIALNFFSFVPIAKCQLPPTGNCKTGAYPPESSRKVPKYVINLDLPPEQRWTKLVAENKQELYNLLAAIKNLTNVVFHGKLFILIDKYMPLIVNTLPYPFGEEIEGIANVTGIPVGEVALFNLFYEIFTVCTSVVVEDTSGVLYHARNLDFGLFLGWDFMNHTWLVTEALRPIVVELDYQRQGKTLFRGINFVGYVGILTAMKPNLFSLTMDERFNLNGGFIGIIEWLLGDHSTTWMGFLTRQVMENAMSYTVAQKMLATTKLLAPAYFILGGNKSGEACVITRDRGSNTDADIWTMDNSGNEWFILETNYDHWKKPPFFDDRRTPAIKCLNHMGQKNASFSGLFNLLSTQPNLNKLTTYTALMQVNTNKMETYLQYCPDPCWPW
ncbi:acid ceramidase-like [Tachypleus tridentatus]|uniref:acid ceramidase-like n=1 Tax=Tachypleus tridentatus TaxID=6853 RepID=UPI003FD39092